MNVLLIAVVDWANVAYELQESLRSVGVEAQALVRKRHGQFKYKNFARPYKNVNELKGYAKNADIIQFMHSMNTPLGFDVWKSGKGIAVFHGGSAYRVSPNKYNKFWNHRVQATLIQTGDLLDKGAKNQVWFLPAINTVGLQPHYKSVTEGKRIIAHRPSSSKKGTVQFKKIMKKFANDPQLKGKFVFETGRTYNWPENIKQMKRCDIYFDACCPTYGNGLVYGEWGIAALEACCLGKVVVSHFLSVDRYRKEYGKECAIQHANNFKQVEKQMRRLILMPDAEFMALRKRTRIWVEENHSRKVIGQKLVNIYNKHLTWKGK